MGVSISMKKSSGPDNPEPELVCARAEIARPVLYEA